MGLGYSPPHHDENKKPPKREVFYLLGVFISALFD